MRSAETINQDLAQVSIDMAALRGMAVRARGKQEIEKARADLDRLAKRGAALRRELAELGAGGRKTLSGGKGLITRETLLAAARERRAIQIGDTGIGAINQIRELFKEIAESDEILNYATYYYGPNASTNIPVLTPMNEPSNYGEAATSVADDTGTSIYVTEIQPVAYAITLPISAEMVQMGAVDIEAELPSIFSKAFATRMHRGMLQGDNSTTAKLMRGIYTSAAAHTAGIITGGSTTITITELAELALTVAGKDASYRIIMNPSVYQGILSDSADGEDIKIYKEGLIRDKSIEGISIFLDYLAPTYNSDNKPIAVAAPLSRYAIGVAGELRIEPIRIPHDTQTYYQAIMFFSGKQVTDTDIYSVVAGKAPASDS